MLVISLRVFMYFCQMRKKKNVVHNRMKRKANAPQRHFHFPPVWVPNPGHVALHLCVHLSRLLPLATS